MNSIENVVDFVVNNSYNKIGNSRKFFENNIEVKGIDINNTMNVRSDSRKFFLRNGSVEV